MTVDPQRLITDAESSAKLRADLELAQGAGVSGLDLAAGATRLRGAIAAEPAIAASSSAAGISVASKLVIGALALGGVGLWLVSRSGEREQPEVVATAPAAASEPLRSAPPVMDPSAVPPSPDLGLERVVVEEPIDEEEPAVDELESQERPAMLMRRSSIAIKPKVASRRVSAQGAPDHRREAELVANARRSLTAHPERAWQLTKQLREEFPRGVLAEERDAIAIRALVALGRTQDAQRLAKTFLAEHGEGPHADAIRRAVGL